MQIKKAGGLIFGAKLTVAEKKALDIEIQREVAASNKLIMKEIDAIILWVLHKKFGWGPVRLKRFYDEFAKEFQDFLKRYEMDLSDGRWLCINSLKDELGIDIEEWEKENHVS